MGTSNEGNFTRHCAEMNIFPLKNYGGSEENMILPCNPAVSVSAVVAIGSL